MIKVSAYCRVSTDHEDQANSLESQKMFFERYINNNPEWELSRLYVDEGITGTNTKKRKAFNNMMEDARRHQFDLLLTKEISRFARNTLDSISYTRELKRLGIGVIFINDNINTLDNDSELRLTIMASIAQEESRKTSERVKWGIKRKMEQGFVWGNHCYGYNLNNGVITINLVQAKVVKLIFQMYLDGYGVLKIKRQLENMGIVSPTGLHSWKRSSVHAMLQNEKYIGVLKQRKEIVIDFLTHEKSKNDGSIEDFIIIQDHHEPIISKDIFDQVQQEIKRRSKMATDDKTKYSNSYAFSGKIKCGLCGCSFHRRYWNGKHEKSNVVWQCSQNVYKGAVKTDPYDPDKTVGCNAKGIHEEMLQEAFIQALESVYTDRRSIIQSVKNVVQGVVRSSLDSSSELTELQGDIDKLESKKLKIIELFADGLIDKQQFRDTTTIYDKQLSALRKREQEIQAEQDRQVQMQDRLKSINVLIERLANLEEFSNEVCKQVLSKVVVYSRDKIDFFLTIDSNADFFIPVLENQHRWDQLGQLHQPAQLDQLDQLGQLHQLDQGYCLQHPSALWGQSRPLLQSHLWRRLGQLHQAAH